MLKSSRRFSLLKIRLLHTHRTLAAFPSKPQSRDALSISRSPALLVPGHAFLDRRLSVSVPPVFIFPVCMAHAGRLGETYLTGVSMAFFWIDATYSLLLGNMIGAVCSMAVGAGSPKLAGSYLQACHYIACPNPTPRLRLSHYPLSTHACRLHTQYEGYFCPR